MRQLESIPPHFEFISIPLTYNLQTSIEKWIHINLSDMTVKKDLAILEGSYSMMDFIKKIQTT